MSENNEEYESSFYTDNEYIDKPELTIDDPAIKKMINHLQFNIKELGIKRKFDDKEFYEKGKNCESSLIDIIKLCKRDNVDYPFIKIYLGKWEIIKELKFWLITQKRDFKLCYKVLIIISFMTEKIDKNNSNNKNLIELLSYLEEIKYELINESCWDSMKFILGSFIANKDNEDEEFIKYKIQTIELILNIIRNILKIELGKYVSNLKDIKEILNKKLINIFINRGGFFDVLIYLSQNFADNYMSDNNMIVLEIFSLIYNLFKVKEIYGYSNKNKFIKKISLQEKYNKRKRIFDISTRHSKFGALFEIKRDKNTSKIYSDLKFRNQKNMNLQKKPQTGKKLMKNNEDLEEIKPKEIDYILDDSQKESLKHYTEELLNYSFISIINKCSNELINLENTNILPVDYISFFKLLSKILEYCKYIIKENKLKDYIFYPIQISYVFLAINKFKFEVSKKKSNMNPIIIYEILKYFFSLFKYIKSIKNYEDVNAKKNYELLCETIFTNEFLINVMFTLKIFASNNFNFIKYYAIKLVDIYFEVLYMYAGNRIINRVKEKKEHVNKLIENEEELEDDYEVEIKHQKCNYLTDLAEFVSYDVINIYISVINEVSLINDNKLIDILSNLIFRIKNELDQAWILYNISFLNFINTVLKYDNPIILGYPGYKNMKNNINNILEDFFKLFKTNNLLLFECMFQYRNSLVKDKVLNNYEINIHEINNNDVNEYRQLYNDKLNSNNNNGFTKNNWNKSNIKDYWSLKEDELLLDQYINFKGMENIYMNISQILKNNNHNKTTTQVKNRLKYLYAEYDIEIARRKIKDIHFKYFTLEKITKNIFKKLDREKIEDFKTSSIEYLKSILDTFFKFREKFDSANLNIPIIPKSKLDFEILQLFEEYFLKLDFISPNNNGIHYWRIPYYLNDMELKNSFNEIINYIELVNVVDIIADDDSFIYDNDRFNIEEKNYEIVGVQKKKKKKKTVKVNKKLDKDDEEIKLLNKSMSMSDISLDLEALNKPLLTTNIRKRKIILDDDEEEEANKYNEYKEIQLNNNIN